MEKLFGKVIEVFIPNNDMYSKYIGFKILINGEIQEFILDINEENANILKDDQVIIIKQKIDNHDFIDIYKEDEYE